MQPISSVLEPSKQFGGNVCLAKTNKGSLVPVWLPPEGKLPATGLTEYHDPRVQQAHKLVLGISGPQAQGMLFCHGHSLGTFERFGYSVFGGPGLERVLADEYYVVGEKTLQGARAGDIIVWWRGGNITHSAKLEIVPVTAPTPKTCKISSKDTFSGFSHRWLDEMIRTWGDNWKIFRRI